MLKFRWETEFKETEIGEIPKDWEMRKFGNILKSLESEKSPKGGALSHNPYGILSIGGKNINWDGSLNLENCLRFYEEKKALPHLRFFSKSCLLPRFSFYPKFFQNFFVCASFFFRRLLISAFQLVYYLHLLFSSKKFPGRIQVKQCVRLTSNKMLIIIYTKLITLWMNRLQN